jgi:hypothetical protein
MTLLVLRNCKSHLALRFTEETLSARDHPHRLLGMYCIYSSAGSNSKSHGFTSIFIQYAQNPCSNNKISLPVDLNSEHYIYIYTHMIIQTNKEMEMTKNVQQGSSIWEEMYAWSVPRVPNTTSLLN